MAWDFDCIVVGAGVVGLAVARSSARHRAKILLVEKERRFGSHGSARNSEVIHAGIYYPPDSLKGQLCVRGRELLYDYCRRAVVPHRRTGKLIVATSAAQLSKLEHLRVNAAALGTRDLRWLDKGQVARLEPDLTCEAALLSPSTGIIDSHQYMLSLLADAESGGAVYAPRTRVRDIEPLDTGFRIAFDDGSGGAHTLTTKALINCGGLFAWEVAAPLYKRINRPLPARHYARGTYFRHAKKAPFSHLIYPVPEDGGLGIHVTLDQGGGLRFGPDVEWIDTLDYTPNPARKSDFVAAIRRYFPKISAGDLEPDFAGIRPRTAPPGEPNDFVIDDLAGSGITNCVHLFGIESPGLTCALAIADHVTQRLPL
ncbi:MAG: NAD(P)/FAD-dependent oxidoreductase [Sphingomonadales bacterium]